MTPAWTVPAGLAGVAVLALLAGLVALGVRAWRREQARLAGLVGLAAARGWTYAGERRDLAHRWAGLPFHRHGLRPRVRHVLSGSLRGAPCVAFDYSYETRSTDGQGRTTTTEHRFAVAVLALPAPLPGLVVTRAGVLDRLAALVGGRDVVLESEAFARRYRVRADDPRSAYDVLTPRTMAALLDGPPLPFRVAGAEALTWVRGDLTAARVDELLGLLATVADGVAGYVWRDAAALWTTERSA